jgi:hypothetical protein
MARTKTKGKRGEKTDAIRAYVATHPNATAPEVVEGLKAQGVTVRVGLVYGVKSYDAKTGGRAAAKAEAVSTNGAVGHKRKRRRRRKSKAAAVAAPAATDNGLNINDLVAAKKLVGEIGSIGKVREALSALARLS